MAMMSLLSDREHAMQRRSTIRHIPGLRRHSPMAGVQPAQSLLLRESDDRLPNQLDDPDPVVPDPDVSPAVLEDATDVKPPGVVVEAQELVVDDREGLAVVPDDRAVRGEPEPPALSPGNGGASPRGPS